MSIYPFRVNNDVTVDLSNPSHNGKWTFVESDGVLNDDKKMKKLTMTIAVPDVRDIFKRRYSISVSADGQTIFAKNPTAPQFIIQDYDSIYKDKDNETVRGHSIFASKVLNAGNEIRSEITAYRLPYRVTTVHFNSARHSTLNNDGVYGTDIKFGHHDIKYQNHNYRLTALYAEVAVSDTIVECTPVDEEQALIQAFNGMSY